MRYLVAAVTFCALTSAAMAADTDATTVAGNLDLVWILVAAGMVMMMQVGFLLLEAGMVRSKNSINVAQKNLLDFVFGVVAFAAIGFMIAFGASDGFVVGTEGDFYFLHNLTTWESGFFVFQVMFCGTAATIVSGAVAERMKLSAYVFGSLFLSGIIYPVFVHWTWGSALTPNTSAFLANLGFVDFAGSTVVHATGGWISLAACMVIGPRLGRFDANGNVVRIAGHNPVLSTTGALLLFIGWIGFNGGSTAKASADMAPIILNTVLAGGMATCVGYVLGYFRDGVVLPEKALCGMLGGLVAVTAGCHVLDPSGALIIGALGAVVAIYGNEYVERRLKIDDAVGAIGVHAFAGVAGTLGLAFLAPVEALPAGGRFAQFYIQVFGSLLNFYWAFGLGYAFFWLLDRIMTVRVSVEDEEVGLNVAEHATRLGVGHVEDALSGLVNGTADLTHRLPVVSGDEAEKLTGLFNRLMDNIEEEEKNRGKLTAKRRDDEEAERVATIANATFEAIVMYHDGIIVDGNEQLASLLGLPLKDLIGRPIYDFLSQDGRVTLQEASQDGVDASFEVVIHTPGGEQIPVEARGRDIVYRGKTMRVGCLVDQRERRAAEQHIRHLALHDPLTGLANRTLFAEHLAASVDRANAGWGCAVVLVDLDHFKDINDIYGHPAGDAVIRETARRLTAALGRYDVAARLGGDEFAVILSNGSFEAQIEDFSRRLIAAFREPFDTGRGEMIKCGVSIGSALCPEHASTSEELINRADVALYQAKDSGRNTWQIFRPGMNELIEKRRALEADIEQALQRDEFELYLQPRIQAATAQIVSYEALIRWHHPERGLVSPSEFIPVAEASGKIIAIGEWVIEQACRLLQGEVADGRLSVNVSTIQFRHPDFLHNLSTIVQRSGIDASRLELEITESVLIDNDKRALDILEALKDFGFRIALDDFGTGYSSLSYLSHYPFDAIKIDQGFVSSLGVEDNAATIVRTIIDLGAGLGMKVVAEGVETIEQALFLAQSGCDELQGYLLGKPLPARNILREIDQAVAVQLRGMPRPASRAGSLLGVGGENYADLPRGPRKAL
ncbi:ammonium transporter [Agrobacterium sp. a22-2]|uniref:ammonium transporter n=1 Tax=Agrobacterium sp. a22-2 TaxID=2283840 RepID=UPI001FEE87F4|nr:ammonium transporter [Agrobacterium sp. a22-2]